MDNFSIRRLSIGSEEAGVNSKVRKKRSLESGFYKWSILMSKRKKRILKKLFRNARKKMKRKSKKRKRK